MRTFHEWLKENNDLLLAQIQELAKELKFATKDTYSISLSDPEGYDDPREGYMYTLYINGREIMEGEPDEILSRLQQIARERGL